MLNLTVAVSSRLGYPSLIPRPRPSFCSLGGAWERGHHSAMLELFLLHLLDLVYMCNRFIALGCLEHDIITQPDYIQSVHAKVGVTVNKLLALSAQFQ